MLFDADKTGPAINCGCTCSSTLQHGVQMDTNANGTLDVKEVEHLLHAMVGEHINKADVRAAMEKLDANQDKRVSFDEFIRVRHLLSNTMHLWCVNKVCTVSEGLLQFSHMCVRYIQCASRILDCQCLVIGCRISAVVCLACTCTQLGWSAVCGP